MKSESAEGGSPLPRSQVSVLFSISAREAGVQRAVGLSPVVSPGDGDLCRGMGELWELPAPPQAAHLLKRVWPTTSKEKRAICPKSKVL